MQLLIPENGAANPVEQVAAVDAAPAHDDPTGQIVQPSFTALTSVPGGHSSHAPWEDGE